MPDLSKILAAKTPLTLAALARGAQPLVLADLARAAKTRAVFIAPDEGAMQAIADTAAFFAPEMGMVPERRLPPRTRSLSMGPCL